MTAPDRQHIIIENSSKIDISTPIKTRDSAIDSLSIVPEQIVKNVETITEHIERHHQNITRPQWLLTKIANFFGKSQFLYFQIVLFSLWLVGDWLADIAILPSSFPTLDLHDQWLDMAALLISTGVLVNESRQEKISEERSHLMLQLNLITEQKIAKLISLVEELRRDLPNVNNRLDFEAELMKQSTDPQAILEVIQQTLELSPSPAQEKNNGT